MTGGANHSRPTSMTYPNGRVITSNYTSGLDADISRLSERKDGSTVLEEYSYLGLGTVVVRAHPQPGVDLSFVKLSGESVGDAGDQYTGLDRFGRIVDQRWRAGSTDKDRYQYTYDRNGNRTAETNVLSSSFNETYTYDSLNQLTGFNRNSGARTQSFDFDALGNWDSVTTNGTAQTRTHNKQNEITAVSGATTPVFDAAGNMTTDETGKQYVYDAWNRLVTVKNSGGNTLATFAYDALTRRVSETASSVTTDLYYSVQWQVVEEHVSGTARLSYVWSPVYVDAMVARDRDSDNNGSLDERLYVTHDANFNVGALIDTSGAVVERFAYDPFGMVSYLNASFGSISASTVAWKYLHQGGRLNADSGFYSFRYRDYSPTLGRWVTMDPIGYDSNDNCLYAYEFGNPIINIDILGTKAGPVVPLVAALAAWLTICALPAKAGVESDAREYGWKNDKFIHCVVACRISRRCGNGSSLFIMASWEIWQEALSSLGITGPNSGGDWEDIVANLNGGLHAGWESRYIGAVGGWIGSCFREDCATSCGRTFDPARANTQPIPKK